MSDFVLFKGRKDAGRFGRDYISEVDRVQYSPDKATRVVLTNGKTGVGTCLACADTPCSTKNTSELAMSASLDAFPGDPRLSVCPTDAIVWDKETGNVSISVESCIGCGLCVVRCPYGAISLNEGAVAHVEASDPDGLTRRQTTERAHSQPKRSGCVAQMNSRAAREITRAVGQLPDPDRNLFVRNLLQEAGMNARVRRKGDTNMRIDAVGFTRCERPFVAEIELVGGELESPRALLEDVAILHARYGFAIQDIDAVSIIMAFPSVRSEYYQVIRDIEKVLAIRCRTLTIGALLAVVWTGTTIDGFEGTAFAITANGIDLSDSLNISDLIEPYPGALKPAK